MRRRSGFTMIELLVALSLVAILSAIALPRVQEAVDRARAASLLERIRSIQTALATVPLTEALVRSQPGTVPSGLAGTLTPNMMRTDDGIMLGLTYSGSAGGRAVRAVITLRGSTPRHQRILYFWHKLETDDHFVNGTVAIVNVTRTPCARTAANGCTLR